MKNQECKLRPEVINVNTNNHVFYYFSVKVNKYSGNCNKISNLYAISRCCSKHELKSI